MGKYFILFLLFSFNLLAAKHVVIISVDGLRPDAIDHAKSKAVNMRNLKLKGFVAANARTIKLSKTLPSHTSMLTGVGLKKHKIDWNSYKPHKGHVKAKTIFEQAKQNNLSTAMFIGKEKLKHIAKPNSLTHFSYPGYESAKVTKSFLSYVKNNKLPNLSFIHMADPDGAGHYYRWMSGAYFKAVNKVDAQVGKIVRFLDNHTKYKNNYVLILTADHGGSGRNHSSNKPENKRIPWIAYGQNIKPESSNKPVKTYDTAATALTLLGLKVPRSFDGKSVL